MLRTFALLTLSLPSLCAFAQGDSGTFVPSSPLTTAEVAKLKEKMKRDAVLSDAAIEEWVKDGRALHTYRESDIFAAFPELRGARKLSECSNSIMSGATQLVFISDTGKNEVTVKAVRCKPVDKGLSCEAVRRSTNYFLESPEQFFSLEKRYIAMSSSQPPKSAGGEQRLFSQASFPEIYEQALVGPLFTPWVEPLFEEAELRPHDRVLDIACGTGIVARLAKERLGPGGMVVGVDLNPQMLAVARLVASTVDWRQGDAGALPLRDDEEFDAVLCQQGFQFFPDRTAAARQMHRALAKGGRLGVSTWRSDEEFPLLRQLRGIAERQVGPVDDRRHSLGDPGPLEIVLREAGFHAVRSKRLARQIRFRDGSVFARLNATALVSMSTQASTLDDAGRQRIIETIASESAELVRAHTDDAGFSFEIGANVVVALA